MHASALTLPIALMLAFAAAPGTARANANYNLGISLVLALGPLDGQARFGVGIDGTVQWFDHPRPYWHDGPNQLGTLTTAGLHLMWVKPSVTAELTAGFGGMYPAFVADGGFMSGIGLQGQVGLAMSTDGSAGPVLGAVVVGPLSEARLEATIWRGWHAPRLAIGPQLTLSGYSYYW